MKKNIYLSFIMLLISVSISAQLYTPPIGSQFKGGIVAYILQPGDAGYISGEIHGLIAAPADLATTNISWHNGTYTLTGAIETAIGAGIINTNIIVSKQGINGIYAASLCANLVLNEYYDWYLPSKDELNKLYLNRFRIGGFTNDRYWSSSEVNIYLAWYQNFTDGIQNFSIGKNTSFHVRAVRSF